jgi:CelD/BcsL family acetyltransferase involved in cellulose biosynthesis
VSWKWVCLGQGKALRILVVKNGAEPIAIAPLMVSHGRLYGLKVRQIESIGTVHSQRFDFIVARHAREAYRAIWKHLLKEPPRWDILRLCQLPAGSRTIEELPKLAAEDGFITGLWHSGDSPYLPLSGTWDSFMKSLDAKHRANLRNRLKRLERLGKVALEAAPYDDRLKEALEEGFRIEAAAWKGRAGTAIRSCPELRHFYTKFAEQAAKRGWLRLYFLTVDQRRIAFHYSVCFKDKLYLFKPGYDPAYAPYSPANLLCYMVVRDAFERGVAEFDLLGEAEPWKLDWTTTTRPHFWFFVFPHTLRGRFLSSVKFVMLPHLRRMYRLSRSFLSGTVKAWPLRRPPKNLAGRDGWASRVSRMLGVSATPAKTRVAPPGMEEHPRTPSIAHALRMKFPAFFLATLGALSLTYAVAVRIVDPRGDFGTAMFPVVELDARTEKMQLFQKYIETTQPDGLILGSSRAMKLSPGTMQAALGQHFFNFAVDNSRADDYLAITRWVRQRGVRLKSLVVGLDVEALHNDDKPDPGLARQAALMQALEQTASPPTGSRTQRSPMAAMIQSLRTYKSTFTITYLEDSVRSLRLFLQPQSRPLPLMEFEPDGYLRYRRWESQRAAGTFQFDRDLERCLYKYVTRFQGMTALSSKRQAYLRQLVQEAQADGIKVAVWITTLHPVTEQYLATHTQYAALLDATRQDLAGMGKTFGIPTYDFSMLGHDQGVDTGWYDCAHIDETNADRVAAALVDALR